MSEKDIKKPDETDLRWTPFTWLRRHLNPKEEVEDLEVPVVSGIEATETKARRRVKEPVISETVELPKVDKTLLKKT